MSLDRRRARLLAATLGVVAAGALPAGYLRLRSSVRQVLDAPVTAGRPLQFVPVAAPARRLEVWGGREVAAVAWTPAGLLTAGGSGLVEGGRQIDGLPTLRASALTTWRGVPVAALEAGGLFRRVGGRWEEARSGWGALHVRALGETAAGELLVGAQEGLFRAAWGATTLERLDAHPVRAIAAGTGFVLAGGEQGLFRVDPGRSRRIECPDPWVESVALLGDELFVVTAAGLARGRREGALARVAGAEGLTSGVAHEGSFWGVAAPPAEAVRRVDAEGRGREERLPGRARRLVVAAGVLFADTDRGLFRRTPAGWSPAVPVVEALPPGSSHVTALAWLGPRLVAGFFDGGLAVAEPLGRAPGWRGVPGSAVWGVNALLPAGGELFVASLRGAARFDGARLRALEGPGAAFSLAATRQGVAIGYGQGVLLPGATLLSAFHGLPGNQALALASGERLFVGTPSGLGALDGRRVSWRVTPGEGRLPHPWVTALAVTGETLYVGTFGGGVARRTASRLAPVHAGVDPGRYEAFPETEGMKINVGCLLEAGGRIFAGTDGSGLLRLSADRARFERLPLPLPSPRVTALLAGPDALYVGTDEGLARVPLPDLE